MIRSPALAAVLALAFALAFAAPLPTASADVAPMEVVLDIGPLRESSGDPTRNLEGVTGGVARVRANGVLCVEAETSDARQVISVGTEEQPDVCSRPGARITLERAEGILLKQHTRFDAGGTFVVDDFSPPPAIDPAPIPMQLVLEPLDGPSPELGPFTHRQVAVFADGGLCAIAETAGATRVEVEVGGDGSPPPCTEPGKEYRLFNGRGDRLFEAVTLVPGGSATVRNFAYPVDPGTPDPWPLPVEPMEIVVESPPVSGQADRRLVVRRGIYICAIRELNEPREVIVVGQSDEPGWCRSPGANLSFDFGAGNRLRTRADFEPGGSFTLDDFTSVSTRFVDVVIDVTADPNATLDVFERITLRADGVACMGLQPPPRVQYIEFDLGLPDGPDACYRPGAFITLDLGAGTRQPAATAVLKRGTRFVVTDLAPWPADSPAAPPMSLDVRAAPGASASLAELTGDVVRVRSGDTVCAAEAVRISTMTGETSMESLMLTVGADTQPPQCRRAGVPIRIVDASNATMVELPFAAGRHALVLVTGHGRASIAPPPAPTGHGTEYMPAADSRAPLFGLLVAVALTAGARTATRRA